MCKCKSLSHILLLTVLCNWKVIILAYCSSRVYLHLSWEWETESEWWQNSADEAIVLANSRVVTSKPVGQPTNTSVTNGLSCLKDERGKTPGLGAPTPPSTHPPHTHTKSLPFIFYLYLSLCCQGWGYGWLLPQPWWHVQRQMGKLQLSANTGAHIHTFIHY